ncbi:hypothetical protein FA13DRAFT_1011258 [Coprinellus micaceus]|nr:hypothetical protein FA13DRAFT_1011258 [Coprinellus micaceus]
MGLPLDVGYGYGTYSNTPPPKSPSDKPLSESSLLCQPVRFSSPPASSPSWDTPAVSRPRLATKSLVASPPVFSAPAPSASPTRPRKHIRSIHLNLDIEDATVEHFELAGYGQFGPTRSPTSPSSSQWSACSHSPGECDSNCSSASLPMSPTPLSPPSPVIGIAASFAPLVPGSPAIRAMEKPEDGGVEGAWQDDVEELNLDAPRPSDKLQFHLPFSLPVASKGNHPLDPTTNEDTLVDVDMKVVKGERKPKAVPERKSVLADPAFFEPPVIVKEDVSVET